LNWFNGNAPLFNSNAGTPPWLRSENRFQLVLRCRKFAPPGIQRQHKGPFNWRRNLAL